MDKKYEFKEDPERSIEGNTVIRLYDENNNELGYYEYDVPAEKWVWLQKLFVVKHYRDLGLSSILIEHFLELARDALKASQINVYIAPLEEGIELGRLINLYAKHGFEIIEHSSKDAEGRIKIVN